MATIVEVYWTDSACTHGWETTLAEIARITTVGYLAQDNDEGIVLVESLNDHPGHAKYGCSTAIPRSAIQKVEILRK